MARERQYLSVLNGWEEAGGAVEAHATELPQLEVMRSKLQDLLAQARSLVLQIDDHTASKQEAQKKLQQVVKQGQRLVDFMRTGAREHFGPDAEILVKFGVNPFRGLARPKKAKPPVNGNPGKPEAPPRRLPLRPRSSFSSPGACCRTPPPFSLVRAPHPQAAA